MKLPGYKILKEVAKKRVITLGEAKKLFTTNFNDERDFFALASLYTERFVDSSMVREGCNWDTNKISLVARELYFMSLGPGKHTMVGVYEDIPDIPGDIINERDHNAEFKIYCTGKTDLFFHEQRAKSIERMVALLIGIFVAVFSAAATAYLTKLIGNKPAAFSFTKNAQENDAENLLITHDRKLTDRYMRNWQEHAQHSEAYVAKAEPKQGQVIQRSPLESKLSEYYDMIWKKIKEHWTIPEGHRKEMAGLETTIILRINREGKFQEMRYEKRSGNTVFDQMAWEAIKKAEPLPPIPKELNDNSLEMGFRFHPN